MKKTVLLSLGMLLGLPMLAAQTDTVVSSHLTNSAGQPLSGYVYFQPALTNGQPTWYRMPGGGTVSSNPVQVTVTNGALSVTLPDTTQTYPSNICFVMSYPGGVLANGYNCLQPHTTAYTASDWCQAGVCNLDNYLPGSQPLASINAVQSINYIAGQITFTGSGFSQSGNTFTFTAGSGCIAQGAAGTLQASTGAGTCVAATAGNIETGLGFTPAASGANSDITSLSAITTPLSASQGGTGGDGTGYAHGNGGSAFTYSPTIPYGVLTGTPTIPTSANWPNAGNCSTGQYLESLANGVAPPTGCAQVQYAQLGGTVPTFNQNTTGSAGGLTGCSTSTAGSICYWSGSAWTVFAGNSSGSNFLQENASGVPSWAAGGGGDSITSPNSTLSVGGTSSATTLDINLAHANTWTAIQTFGTDISIGGIQPSGATGTGNLVFGTSPTLVTPILGIPTSGTLTNTTGYLWNNLTNPTGTLSLTLPAADTTTFTWSAAASPSTVDWTWTAGADTGTSTVSTFIFDDTTGNTRTGPLIDIHSVGTSTILPVRFTAQGTANGVDMTSAGLLQAIGSGGINATELSGKSLTGSGAGVTSGPTSDASSDIATFTGTVGQIQDSEVQIGTTGSDVLQLSGGLVPSVNLPKATTSAFGAVEGDNSTITLSSGVISCTTATTSQLGCVKPDGSTITISGGVISASGSMTWPSTAGYALYSGSSSWSTPHLFDNAIVISSTEGLSIAPTSSSQVGLIVNNPTSTSADIADFQVNGSTEASIGDTGIITGNQLSLPGDGTHAGMASFYPNTTVPTLTSGDFSLLGPNAASVTAFAWQSPTATNSTAGLVHVGAESSDISQLTVSQVSLTADVSGVLPIANGGSSASTAANALINLFPTASEVGDLVYCATYSSGCTSWALLAGNSSGSNFLQENASGVPSWAAGGGGSGTVSAAAQYDVAYYTQSGTTAQVGGAAISGFQFDSTSGAPAAATAAQLGTLANIAQYDLVVSAGNSSALAGIAPSSTSGVALCSQGSSANPAYCAINLAGGSSIVTGVLPLGSFAQVPFDSQTNDLTTPTGNGSFTFPNTATTGFTLSGTAPSSVSTSTGTAAMTLFTINGVTGGATSNASGTAGVGSSPSLTTGTGGAGTGTNAVGGNGGSWNVTTGGGGASNGTGANSNGGNAIFTMGVAGLGGSGTVGATGEFEVTGTQPASQSGIAGVNVGTLFGVLGVTGGTTTHATSAGGIGSNVSVSSGGGGNGDTSGAGGAGGTITQTTGAGGTPGTTGQGGAGGAYSLTTGTGHAGGSTSGTGGAGGAVGLTAGNGGAQSTSGNGGPGGTVTITSGNGGNGATTGGVAGNIDLLLGTPGTGGSPATALLELGSTSFEVNASGDVTAGIWQGTAIGVAYGGLGANNSSSTGVVQFSSGTESVSTALPNGTTATTQTLGDNTTQLATDAFVLANAGSGCANALTMNNGGSGASSGSTFNCGAAVTLSYNTIGAAPAVGNVANETTSWSLEANNIYRFTGSGASNATTPSTTGATGLISFVNAGTATVTVVTGGPTLVCLPSSCAAPVGASAFINTDGTDQYAIISNANGSAFGTAANDNTGTSGANVPLLNGTNTWSGVQTFGTNISIGGQPLSGGVQGSGDTKALLAGTVSGTSALLCTDANGGATTSSCPSGGSGTVNASAQYDVAYYPTSGTVATVQGAAVAGFVYGSASGAPAAATQANLGTLLNITSGDVLVSGGSGSAVTAGAVAANLVVASSPGAGVAHFAGSTQTVTSSTIATADIAANAVTLAKLATQGANTVLANVTGSTAVPTAASIPAGIQFYTAGTGYSTVTGAQWLSGAGNQTANTVLGALTATTPSDLAMPSCSSASNALTWTSGTGFGCNTSITAAATPLSGITGLGSGVATALGDAPSSAGGMALYVASGTAAMNTAAVASGACETVVTVSATSVATTDTVLVGFNGDPTAVTGYGVSATGAMLTIYPYPSSGDVNFKVCNSTSASITPGALTLNWRVLR